MDGVIASVTSRFLAHTGDRRRSLASKDAPSISVPSRSTLVFVLGCLAWYTSSSLSSNTSKALLSKQKVTDVELPYSAIPPAFPYPVTLTLIHFAFVNACCAICASRKILGRRALTRLVKPTWSRVAQVGQLAFFNVLGQALSSLAISRVPVSTVHTIKALSPLFTVVSYTFLFNVHYSSQTYMSLLPLTAGVMMACTGFAFSSDDVVGLVAALTSTFVFVAQNIYSKKLLRKPENTHSNIHGESHQLDKLNILFYSSACSIVLMVPMALYYDGASLWFAPIGDGYRPWNSSSEYPSDRGWLVVSLLLVNGFVHFSQNILAFNVLSMVSPVTYSIASLLKRVFVIVLAIIWFHQPVSFLQWIGIALTFYGLWMYNDSKTKQDVAQNEARASRKQDSEPDHILPLNAPLSSTSAAPMATGLYSRPPQHSAHHHHALPQQQHHRPYIPPHNPGGWNDIPLAPSASYIRDPTKSLPSPPDSDKGAD